MTGPEGNSEILFPENLNVSRDEVEGNIKIRGKHWHSRETKFTVPQGTSH